MKEYQEDGKIIIKFVKSEDNEATKNKTNAFLQNHQKKLVWDKVEVGSHQVPFPMCTLETLQKYCSTGSLLLTFC